MEIVHILSGGAPVLKKYMAGTTMSTAGIPVLGAVDAATDLGSIEPAGASVVTNTGSQVGLLIDTTGTVAATGITDNDAIFGTVCINPDAIIRAKANNGTTEDTALPTITPSSASATGVTINGGSSAFDNGIVWGYTGDNVGQFRRASDTAGAVSINFINAVATTDTYVACVGFPCGIELTSPEMFDLTTLLTQIDSQTVEVTNNNFIVVDFEAKDASDDGVNNSFYHLIANNHAFGSSSIA